MGNSLAPDWCFYEAFGQIKAAVGALPFPSPLGVLADPFWYGVQRSAMFGNDAMKHLAVVDAEGGPLLLADAEWLQKAWRGVEADGSGYQRACDALGDDLQGCLLSLDTGSGIVWNMEGAGTADIYTDLPSRILIVRVWINEPDDMQAVHALAALPLTNGVSLGTLRITSGVLAVLSAVEDGQCIQSLAIPESARPTGDMMTDSSGLLLRVPNGDYACWHDTVSLEDEQSARRCHLVRV